MTMDLSERYDRQIRLWGQHGQDKCSNSKVCLINANALGSEILKGLCLAGIGSFTILDSNKLSTEDVDAIFLSESQIGRNRGEAVKSMMLDLNEDVKGDVITLETCLPLNQHKYDLMAGQTLEHLFADSDEDLNFWKQFNCIVASGFLHVDQIKRLSMISWYLGTPLVFCKSVGFYGHMRSQLKEHLVNDTHPEFGKNSPEVVTTNPFYLEDQLTFCNPSEDVEEDMFLTIDLSLRAMDIFFSTYGRLPGCQDDQVETDITKLKSCFRQIITKPSNRLSSLDQCLYELCRYGGSEIHTTVAFLGGCVCQEVIKLITNQYTPVNDILVYDAMAALTKTFRSSETYAKV